MEPLLDRFCDLVDDNLGDPHTTRRYPRAKKLRDFYSIEKQIWERLKVASGSESVIGRAAASLTVETDKEFYQLPGNFAQFLRMTNDSTGTELGTIADFEDGPGIVMLSGQRGFRWKPVPDDSDSGAGTLTYQKGPVELHYANAAGVSSDTITFSAPGENGGTLVALDNYYSGSIVRIYDAATGAGQAREITSFDGTSLVAKLRHAWTPVPTGTVRYEICPILPTGYDDLYALDVTILAATRRAAFTRRRFFIDQRRELWNACLEHFTNLTADRAPSRRLPEPWDPPDPYFHFSVP